MDVKKKVTDFIRLEEGNIGRQAAVVTGALLASSVLGTVVTSPVKASTYYDHVNKWDYCHNEHEVCHIAGYGPEHGQAFYECGHDECTGHTDQYF